MRTLPLALVGAAAWLLPACEDDPVLQKLPEPEVHVDELKQKPAAQVDILWVVDNSGSMVEEQAALAANFDRFITGLTLCQATGMANDLCDFSSKKCSVSGAPCNPPDYHIGVIATDVVSPTDSGRLRTAGLCVPRAGATPSGDKHRYCGGGSQDCAHDAADPSSDPANNVCDTGQRLGFVTPTTKNAAGAFGRIVKVGVGGSGLEQGIRAAAMAVGRDTNRTTGQWSPAPAENNGFFRPEASLFVIFVSDEEDSSFGQPAYFYRAFETLKGAGNEGLVSLSSIVGDPDPDGPAGPAEGGCVPQGGQNRNNPGTRYVALSMYSRGYSSELRVCDDQRLTCDEASACTRPFADLPGICVPKATCTTDQDCGNFKCGDNGCIRCSSGACSLPGENFLSLLSRNGIYGSICTPDYGEVLGSLGFEAAGLRRKFALTKAPDCAKTVPCCAEGTADAQCQTTAPVCVRVSGQPVPNERASGWVYEAASNSIFFDGSFVPQTDAPVTISYRLSKAGAPLSCTTALR